MGAWGPYQVSPRVGPLEIGGASKKDPRRDPSDPPVVERVDVGPSEAQQVATFRTSRFQIGLPSAVLLALIAAGSAGVVAWINKPPPPVVSPLTHEQSQQLEQCARLAQDVGEIKTFVRWAEPQIGILLVRTDARAYTPPPRVP